MTLNIVLPLGNPSALEQFLSEVYDPNSRTYHQYVTPAEFTARFGPSQQDYDAVLSFAKANGFRVIGGSRDGMNVVIRGPVSAVESALPRQHAHLSAPHREPHLLRARSRAHHRSSFQLWHVAGLDNFSTPHPLYAKKSDYATIPRQQRQLLVSHATTGSGPSASFLGSDMRAAYYGSGSLNGAGQNLGLFEY